MWSKTGVNLNNEIIWLFRVFTIIGNWSFLINHKSRFMCRIVWRIEWNVTCNCHWASKHWSWIQCRSWIQWVELKNWIQVWFMNESFTLVLWCGSAYHGKDLTKQIDSSWFSHNWNLQMSNTRQHFECITTSFISVSHTKLLYDFRILQI